MHEALIPVLLTVAGALFLFRNLVMLRDETKLRHYVETSPKALLWRRRLGVERTVDLSRNYFLPAGVAVSGLFLAIGLLGLVAVASASLSR